MSRAVPFLIVLALTVAACSEDDNPVWWTGGVRGSGEVIPDTLLLDAVRDTTVEVELSTGSSRVLLVGRLGGVESVAFLRYSSLPDSADNIEAAEISFLVSGGYGEPVRLRMDAVSTPDWTEADIRWDNQPPVSNLLDQTDDAIVWVEGDTIPTAAMEIPVGIMISWIEDSTSNGGIRLSVPATEPDGILRILASEAVLDTSVVIVNPPLTISYDGFSPSTHGPANDAFVHNRFEGDPWGADPAWLGVGGWRTRRTVIGFDIAALRDSIRMGPTFSVAGAALLLTALAEAPDDLPYADSLDVSIFGLADDPAWEEGGTFPDSLPIQETIILGDIETNGEAMEFGITNVVRAWIETNRTNGGLLVTTLGERTSPEGIRFASRGDAAIGPRLRIVVTRPAPTRLGIDP